MSNWIDFNNIEECQKKAVEAVDLKRPNAEWRLLVMWAALQMEGVELDPDFELLATSLLISAIAHERMPTRRGRPRKVPHTSKASDVQLMFNELEAASPQTNRENVIANLAEHFHLSERSVENRLASSSKTWTKDPDATASLLRGSFQASGKAPSSARQNSVLLAMSRRTAAKLAARKSPPNSLQ